MIALYVFLGLLCLFLLIVLMRTLAFRPRESVVAPVEEVCFDRDAAVYALRELVICKTISRYDHAEEDEGEFAKLIDKLVEAAQRAHEDRNLRNYAFTSDILKSVSLGGAKGAKGAKGSKGAKL